MMLKKLASSALVAALLAGGAVALSSTTANAAGCSAFANTPYKTTAGNGTARGTAGRINCSGSAVNITARLMHYQPAWADITRAQSSGNYVNWTASLSWARPDTATAIGWDWYTDASTSTGQKARSNNIKLWR